MIIGTRREVFVQNIAKGTTYPCVDCFNQSAIPKIKQHLLKTTDLFQITQTLLTS